MSNILIFKTASDVVMKRLFDELQTEKSKKICLIQSSLVSTFQGNYPDVLFVDSKREGFYGIEDAVMQPLKEIEFEKIYIPTTGVRATNFGNIIDLCKGLSFQELVFYNCNGEHSVIKKKSHFSEMLIKMYINFVEMLHKK